MKLEKIVIKDFKRFTHLTIKNIPETARLIMLFGPNGCGKSSLFDALYIWLRAKKTNIHEDGEYYSRVRNEQQITSHDIASRNIEIDFHGGSVQGKKAQLKKVFYMRSAYRNDPDFRLDSLQQTQPRVDEQRFQKMIENDAAVANNYRRLASNALEDVFEREDKKTEIGEFRKKVIGDMQEAFAKLFPDVLLDSLGNPLTDGTFRFTKGTSRGFAFKNLSGGEKAAFDLILDLITARREYNDTVFCIDEPESHMNARLQAELLSVLCDLIPENCQLMLATHSIGMIRRARDIENENPGSVVFLDFEDRDFDCPQVIEPVKPSRTFWKNAYKVALDDLAALVAPEQVVICEGHPRTKKPVRNHSQDARCYERIFESEFPETRFVSMGNDKEVLEDKHGLVQALLSIVDGLDVLRLIDRDDRSDQEVANVRDKGVRVLSRRNIESYLFDDEVLRELAASQNQKSKVEELLAAKRKILSERSQNPPDDLKHPSGRIYVECRKILNLTQHGNSVETFMRDTLSPLIKPGMSCYDQLKQDIFGDVCPPNI